MHFKRELKKDRTRHVHGRDGGRAKRFRALSRDNAYAPGGGHGTAKTEKDQKRQYERKKGWGKGPKTASVNLRPLGGESRN